MTLLQRATLLAMTAFVTEAWGQGNPREPHIGYLYPAGGRQGSVFEVLVGGQSLQGVTDVYVSGEGVHASVIQYYRPIRNLSGEQRQLLRSRMRELIQKRWDELAKAGRVEARPPWGELRTRGRKRSGTTDPAKMEEVKLPEHPLLRNLEDKSLRELLHVRDAFLNLRKRQPNAQIAESVLIEVTVDSDAILGDRELRFGGRMGLTNPMVLQVGPSPEIRELESNDPNVVDPLPKEPPIDLPVVINGQIMPGDVDRFRFRAQQGQQLVITAHARRLIPYLADAVPGWFQATLAVYDANGNEVAFADDYRFDPDPVLYFEVPDDGEYELEIHDSIYRGRDDFVYRIAVGEQPFITSMFPLGSQTGHDRYAAVEGWNLPTDRLFLDAQSDGGAVRQATWGRGERSSNQVAYALDTLQASKEAENNDTMEQAQRITPPRIVNGRIEYPGDVDIFQFKGSAGAEIVAEVVARRLQSPLDSLLRLIDASGCVLEWNDDYEHKEGFLHTDMGLLTHHADSYLRAKLPADGIYYVQLTDAQAHGGEAYGYRLRVGPPQPDFALRLTPSSINVPPGRAAPLSVYVLRKDGFDGAIELSLQDAPRGFALNGGRIPAGRDRVRMTLTAPPRRLKEPITIKLEGRATIDGKTIIRPVVPADDMMQAFLYRHLTPAQTLMVAGSGGGRFGQSVELAGDGPVRIPADGTTEVRIKTARNPSVQEIELQLSDPPAGITLENVAVGPNGLTFQLGADGEALPVGFADNLIIEAFTQVERKTRDGKATRQKQRVSLGVLPAIPVEIVRR